MVQNPKLLPLQGKTIAEIAKLWKKDPIDTIFDFLIEDNAFTEVAVFGMSEPDVRWRCSSRGSPSTTIRRARRPTVCSARSIRIRAPTEHFRAFCASTFARNKVLTLPDAIRKFSALPAQRMRLTDRGVLKAGMWADIVVFDPATVRDLATFEKPNQLSEGMQYVLVNGVPVIEREKMTALAREGVTRAGVCP